MITVFFGQPNSGKTTLARRLSTDFNMISSVVIDGDDLRELFKNSDYSKEGRIKNLNRASDIAVYINSLDIDVILSLIYPYQETRDYLNSLCPDVKWFYLVYNGIRGRENYHLKEFDQPSNAITINTSDNSIEECLKIVKNEIYPILLSR